MANLLPKSGPASIARRHDLDALRAFAMLLGIVLHGAMSFLPMMGSIWPVQDTRQSMWFGVLVAPIHGFRMPLFFLISGFFTAMLWRKRGMKALIAHRFRRVFLPLVMGMLTVIPAMWAVSGYIRWRDQAIEAAPTSSSASRDDSDGGTDIIAAACFGDTDSLKSLIGRGADLNVKDDRGSTPLHVAFFFGRADAARLLLDAGADATAVNNDGKRPVDLLYVPWELTRFIANLAQIDVNEEQVLRGREEIGGMIDVPSDGRIADAVGGQAGFGRLMDFLMYIPLFGHLWFLWFLCWLVIGFMVCVNAARRLKLRRLPKWITLSIWRYAWLIPLTAVPQFFMGQASDGIGPDTSVGLIPIPAVFFYYAVFFGFGTLYFDADDRDGRVGRCWWIALPLALLLAFPVGIATRTQGQEIGRAVSAVSQVAYAWLVSFGLMGLSRQVLCGENKAVRYLSDSSYWLYLAHLPIVMWVQYLVRDSSIPAWVKLTLVCAITTGLLLISYQLFVRYTPIGTVLNGPRRREPKTSEPKDAVILAAKP